MRKLYVYVAKDRQLQASNRDPFVETPNRTVGTRPQDLLGPGPGRLPCHRIALEVIERCRPGVPRIRASYPAMRVPALCECLHLVRRSPHIAAAVGLCGAPYGSHSSGGFVEGEDA